MQKSAIFPGIKIIVLALILFGINTIDYLGLGLNETVKNAPLAMLAASFLNTLVIACLVLRSRWNGWRLAAAIFLIFYGVNTFLVAIEAVYLSEVMGAALTQKLFVNGAISAGLFSWFTILMLKGTAVAGSGSKGSSQEQWLAARPWWAWISKLALASLIWVVLFILTGLLVFQPLARALDPAVAEAYIAGFDSSAGGKVLLFQTGRAILWVLLAGPALRMLIGSRWEKGLVVALLFSVLMGSNLLIPSGLPAAIQKAHLLEVFSENFLFGWVVVWLFGQSRAARLEQRYPGQLVSEKII